MSAIINSRRINNVVDQRASLGNDQVLRLIPVGVWNKIRVAVRLTINASASIGGTPRFYFGMCEATTALNGGAGSQITLNFVGILSTDTTWNYSTLGTPANVSTDVQGCHRSFGVNTLSTSSANMVITADPTGYRCFLAVTIDKTVPSASTVEVISISNTVSGVYDVSLPAFFEQLKSETVVTLTDYDRTVFTGTFDLSFANLDAVNLSYNKTPNRIEVCDISYHVFS